MKKNTVIFDIDGTLLDTTEGVLEAVKYAASTFGYQELTYDTLLNFVGPPMQDSFVRYYGCSREKAQEAANVYRSYYKERSLTKAVPYEGIFELCEELQKRGVKMAAASYKREDYAVKVLEYFGFDKFMASMHGADNNNVLKKSDIINLCFTETGASREEAVYIGDTVNDAVGASGAGVDFLAVTYGFGFKTPDDITPYPFIGVADRPLDILKLLA